VSNGSAAATLEQSGVFKSSNPIVIAKRLRPAFSTVALLGKLAAIPAFRLNVRVSHGDCEQTPRADEILKVFTQPAMVSPPPERGCVEDQPQQRSNGVAYSNLPTPSL